jgi:hypothetical protein
MAGDLDGLPAPARARLGQFSRALERVHVDDLPLYAVRPRQPDHRRAVESAAVAVREANLDEPLDAARSVLIEYVGRAYAGAQFRASWVGLNTAPGLGPTDDRVRVMRSLGDAVMALVAWDALEEFDREELLGAWAKLLP